MIESALFSRILDEQITGIPGFSLIHLTYEGLPILHDGFIGGRKYGACDLGSAPDGLIGHEFICCYRDTALTPLNYTNASSGVYECGGWYNCYPFLTYVYINPKVLKRKFPKVKIFEYEESWRAYFDILKIMKHALEKGKISKNGFNEFKKYIDNLDGEEGESGYAYDWHFWENIDPEKFADKLAKNGVNIEDAKTIAEYLSFSVDNKLVNFQSNPLRNDKNFNRAGEVRIDLSSIGGKLPTDPSYMKFQFFDRAEDDRAVNKLRKACMNYSSEFFSDMRPKIKGLNLITGLGSDSASQTAQMHDRSSMFEPLVAKDNNINAKTNYKQILDDHFDEVF